MKARDPDAVKDESTVSRDRVLLFGKPNDAKGFVEVVAPVGRHT